MPRLPADPEGFIRANTALEAPAIVPEFKLWLASEYVPIWQATEAWLEEQNIDPPYWAFCWPGGQAIARYLLDHPETVRGKRVVDFASGSGIVAVAAAKAGAERVLAADIDAFCGAAAELNAAANGVAVEFTDRDLLDRAPPAWAKVILAGDICYEKPLAERVMAWLAAGRAQGATVLIGDPGRSYFPRQGLEKLTEYHVPTTRELEDMEVKKTAVWAMPEGYAA